MNEVFHVLSHNCCVHSLQFIVLFILKFSALFESCRLSLDGIHQRLHTVHKLHTIIHTHKVTNWDWSCWLIFLRLIFSFIMASIVLEFLWCGCVSGVGVWMVWVRLTCIVDVQDQVQSEETHREHWSVNQWHQTLHHLPYFLPLALLTALVHPLWVKMWVEWKCEWVWVWVECKRAHTDIGVSSITTVLFLPFCKTHTQTEYPSTIPAHLFAWNSCLLKKPVIKSTRGRFCTFRTFLFLLFLVSFILKVLLPTT